MSAAGALFGLAFGDALGAPTEFLRSVADIRRAHPPDGPRDPEGEPALVTDDTQMALAVADALAETGSPLEPAPFAAALARTFVAWSVSPENDRAPGATCLRACRALADGAPWIEATQPGSKGCGANMRVAPVALVPGIDDATLSGAAQLQAAITHGHPTALAASDLTARCVKDLLDGGDAASLVARLVAYARARRTTYPSRWIGELWRRTGDPDPSSYAARGWDECLAVLARVETALATPDAWRDPAADPCDATGAGWIAEEAFATGLLCFLLHPDDPVAAVRRAAATSGDSDSIACLAGSFAGARHPLARWPERWLTRIEYRARLAAHADRWQAR